MTTPVTSAVTSNARVLTGPNVTRALASQARDKLGTVRELRSRTATVLVAVLIGAGVLAGCGNDDDTSSQEPVATAVDTSTEAAAAPTTAAPVETATTAAAAQAPATTTAAAPVETRPEILLLDTSQVDGQPFELAAAVGNDVLLWFWAPW